MTRKKIQSIVGILLILGQCFILCYIFYRLNNLFLLSQALDLTALISPLFCTYLILVTKNFLSKSSLKKESSVSFNFMFVSLFYPVIFIGSLFIAIKLYDRQTIESFEDLKKIIGLIETTFGIYLGIVIDKIFPNSTK
ncbi:MAG TPA: hypothetical protein VFW07_14870 [Parafilimonas sp.]|nr:hypothetical protein [Parafilimonas sp.]